MTNHSIASSGVKVTHVRVSNFRSLTNIEVALEDLTVLVGANNAGKTSFLDAMYAAIGAGRKSLGQDDIHVATGEALPPLERQVVIDIRVRPVDGAGNEVDNFPAGSYWVGLWGPGISQDEEFRDVMAFRTTLSWSLVKGDYVLDRKFLKEWKPALEWLASEMSDKTVTTAQIEPLALHYIDAKRDLDDDLRRQGSFWRRLTDNLGLSAADVAEFESVLSSLNQEIVSRSEVLKHLKDNLVGMSSVVSADSAGVEIAPVARRLRDLSKGVDVTFATMGAQAFPLTRHGMGTRSLASLLVFRAFSSWRYHLAAKDGDHIHTLLALEEPESHLHPQAQRALFSHIKSIPGQRIVSTHSPYFAGQAKLEDIRLFTKHAGITSVAKLDLSQIKVDDRRKLEREVIASRGDLLFARALVLFEGETEEQALPLWAETYWGASVHELGFSFVSVGGQNYFPFIWLANSFGIPWFVFSDGEAKTIAALRGEAGRAKIADIAAVRNIFVLPNGNDFEAQLLSDGYLPEIEAVFNDIGGANALDEYISDLHGKPGKKVDGVQPIRDYHSDGGRTRAALDMMRDKKTRHAAPIASKIAALPDKQRRIPPKVSEFFDVITLHFGLACAIRH
ncbi:AAA family ATPase [Aquitalea sp.]|uniref:ATP-dependent nuclease n=1 Tax=Aquitalea sp. TaxID=1872623 RepID=UPI00258E8F6D|nr:AAA family ATPase [Aquitalea sp.]